MEMLKKNMSEMKIDYDFVKREKESILSGNFRLKNELNECKKSMNEYIFDMQQVMIENQSLKRIKEALTKESENHLKIIEEISNENHSLKENLIENNAFEIKFRNDTKIEELEKIVQLAKERVKHIENQNNLLTQTYNQHLEEIMDSRSNIAKDAVSLLLKNFHNSLNNFLDKENNSKLDPSILASLTSKSFLNAALNETRKNLQPEARDISRSFILHPEVSGQFADYKDYNRKPVTTLSAFILNQRPELSKKVPNGIPSHSPGIKASAQKLEYKKAKTFVNMDDLTNKQKMVRTNSNIEIASDVKSTKKEDGRPKTPYKSFDHGSELNKNILSEPNKNSFLSEFSRSSSPKTVNQMLYFREDIDRNRNQNNSDRNKYFLNRSKTPEGRTNKSEVNSERPKTPEVKTERPKIPKAETERAKIPEANNENILSILDVKHNDYSLLIFIRTLRLRQPMKL